jgi:hypothetical protein
MAKTYVIICMTYNDDFGCYWSNDLGWIKDVELANKFNQKEQQTLNLPIGGKWQLLIPKRLKENRHKRKKIEK